MHLEAVDGLLSSPEFLEVDGFTGTTFTGVMLVGAHFLGGVFIFSCVERIEYSSL